LAILQSVIKPRQQQTDMTVISADESSKLDADPPPLDTTAHTEALTLPQQTMRGNAMV
jgi:hypothetical protein